MPQTLHLRADSPADIQRAAELLRAGGTVAFATETVYGLGADALDPAAVRRIFKAKQRPAWDPLIVHLADVSLLRKIAVLDPALQERVERLASAFWPGPLTLLLPRSAAVPDEVTAGRDLVGVRVPAHPAARALLQAAAVPVAAPSANLFGHTSPTTAAHVLADLDGRIDAVLDAGPTPVGVESSVLDPAPTPMVLYRPGAITAEMLSHVADVPVEIFKPVQVENEAPQALPSPGVGIRHYAPRAMLVLVEGTERALRQAIEESVRSGQANARMGVLLPTDWHGIEADVLAEPWAIWGDAAGLAARLFAGLRALDERGATIIVCPLPPAGGLNDAIRDRLLKAARPG